MSGFALLKKRLEARVGEAKGRANKRRIRFAARVLRNLLEDTPVDTSAALSNWQVSVGVATRSVIPAYISGDRGSTQSQSIKTALLVGTGRLKSVKPGETIYISNNIRYISGLNRGDSTQAPKGFVQAALIRARGGVGASGIDG